MIGAIGSAAAQAPTVIIARCAPPPPRVKTIPPLPATMMTWQAGHWYWNGSDWSWIDGHYLERPHTAAVSEPGHWTQQPTG
jgi:hypothetical protein